MTPSYDFERFDPPALDERALRRELERREARRNTILLAIAGALFQALFVLLGVLYLEVFPLLSLGCFCFVLISTAGSGAVAIVYVQKGEVNCGFSS